MWRIIEAYDQLNAWIRASEGQFIELDNGESYRFVRRMTFTGRELEQFEQDAGFELPPEYRRFLIGVGAVELFAGPLSAGIEVRGPGELADFSRQAFGGTAADPYPALLPAVSLSRLGRVGLFRPAGEREERYGLFDSAACAENRIDAGGFASFDEWIAELVENRGHATA